MNKKIGTAIIIMLTALLIVTTVCIYANPQVEDHSSETVTFNVSSGANPINETIKYINTLPYYEGHSKECVEWMESLGDKKVFYGHNTIIIMNSSDAERIPPEPGITDVYIYNIFKADVIENHSLVKDHEMVYYVENVEFINQEIVGNGLA